MRESLIRTTEKRLVCFVLNTYIDTCVCVHVAAEKRPTYNSLVFSTYIQSTSQLLTIRLFSLGYASASYSSRRYGEP